MSADKPFGQSTCSEDGCKRKARASGRCANCYSRLRAGGPPRGDGHKLTPDEIATARRMSAAFKTQDEIAVALGCSRATVGKALKR